MASYNNSAPYDPPLDRSGQASRDHRTTELQKKIDEAQDTMHSNIAQLSERGTRLNQLQDKTDQLSTQANGFRRGANRVRKQMWWKDMKMRMCIIAGIVILLLVIIVPAAYYGSHHK